MQLVKWAVCDGIVHYSKHKPKFISIVESFQITFQNTDKLFHAQPWTFKQFDDLIFNS